jgi:hypothetical protein
MKFDMGAGFITLSVLIMFFLELFIVFADVFVLYVLFVMFWGLVEWVCCGCFGGVCGWSFCLLELKCLVYVGLFNGWVEFGWELVCFCLVVVLVICENDYCETYLVLLGCGLVFDCLGADFWGVYVFGLCGFGCVVGLIVSGI